MRAQTPLVHCITNAVVTNFTANTLLAIGAAPVMVDIVGEIGPFARAAGSLLVNLGIPSPEQRAASEEAVAAAVESGTPWVLGPVAVGPLPIRTALAEKLATTSPFAIRGNASEILELAGVGEGGKGVDATASTDAAATGTQPRPPRSRSHGRGRATHATRVAHEADVGPRRRSIRRGAAVA